MSSSEHTGVADGAPASSAPTYTIILFYLYTRVPEPQAALNWQEATCKKHHLKGRIRIASEGINGTLAGTPADIQAYIDDMNDTTQPLGGQLWAGIEYKYSTDTRLPFPALGMFNVKELTATGAMAKSVELLLDRGQQARLANVRPAAATATTPASTEAMQDVPAAAPAASTTLASFPPTDDTHLTPAEFHEAVKNLNPETDLLLDVRNAYETQIGTFEGAVDPKLRTFAQLPEYVTQNIDAIKGKKKILMFCTGGIRCEKASLYLAHRSGAQVQQLKGGIHKYMDEFPDGGLFRGKNFVFDDRLAMASQDKTIVGKCVQCAVPCDDLSESVLCRVCKQFIILCPTCRQLYTEKGWQFYCSEHILLAAGKDYQPDAAASSAAAASTTAGAPVAPSALALAATDATNDDETADRPEDAWSPPASDPGCPEQLNLFLARFTIEQLQSQIDEIDRILHYFRTHQKKAGSRSKNRKANLHTQRTRLQTYLNERRRADAIALGEPVPAELDAPQPTPEQIAEMKKKRAGRPPTPPPTQPGQLVSFVPLLNV